MEKRQNRTALVFSIVFVLLLVIAAGSFLFGLRTGIGITEARYKVAEEAAAQAAKAMPAEQQDLVVFYNSVFLPYREFQSEWNRTTDLLKQGKLSNAASAYKKLSDMAASKYEEAGSVDMQRVQMIGGSQVSYLRSLKLFEKAATDAAGAAAKADGKALAAQLAANANYKAAVKQQLSAQQAFYDGMLKWTASVNSSIPSEYKLKAGMKLAEWKKLPLVVKNKLMADLLQSQGAMTDYLPQDLATRVDELIASEQAQKHGLTTVSSVIDLLTGTGSVRSGDYASSTMYANEALPDLPLF